MGAKAWAKDMCLFFLPGKQKCSSDASHILRVLSDLLGHENHEV